MNGAKDFSWLLRVEPKKKRRSKTLQLQYGNRFWENLDEFIASRVDQHHP